MNEFNTDFGQMDGKQKRNLLIIALLLIALIVGIFVVRQRQEIRKKAAIETPLQLILNPQTATLTPGQLIAPTIQIDNTSGSTYAITGVEAKISIGAQIGVLTTGTDCLAPFNGLESVTLDDVTHTVTILCAISPDQAPSIIQANEKKNAIKLSLVAKTSPLGPGQLNFIGTRVTQAGAAGSGQAVNLSSGGVSGTYTVANPTATSQPTATTTANRPPNCSGGITITGKTPVSGTYQIQKGETVQLVANGLSDPDQDPAANQQFNVVFRIKSVQSPPSEQCPVSGDNSEILGFSSGGMQNGEFKWFKTFNTSNIAPGMYYIWANPSDGQAYCSGNPFASSQPDKCGATTLCTNCFTRAVIDIQPTTNLTPTLTPKPTTPIGGLTLTPSPSIILPTEPITPPGGAGRLIFKIKAPDILSSVTSIPADNIQVQIYNGTGAQHYGVNLNPSLGLIRNGDYFTGSVNTNSIPATGQYIIDIKLGNTIQRRFRNVTLTKDTAVDCTGSNTSCGELVSAVNSKTLHSGDSDQFNRLSGSFNKIDANDVNNYIKGRFKNEGGLIADFNSDGIVNVSDLAIWAKNENKNGE